MTGITKHLVSCQGHIEGGRGHVTTHTANVLSEIQTHVPDMPKIDIE